MARLPRYVLPGHPQHIIHRGNNKSIIFHKETDYLFYLKVLKEASEKCACTIHAYVLMTNHVHLLVTPKERESISTMQQIIGRHYVRYFNDKYKRTGTLWEGRYKATLIDSEQYLLTCMRYIEMNPVRARMVAFPEEYQWSSYRANAIGESNEITECHSEYIALGKTPLARQEAYLKLFETALAHKTLNEIRSATNSAWILGSEEFKNNMIKSVERRISPLKKGGDHKSIVFNASCLGTPKNVQPKN